KSFKLMGSSAFVGNSETLWSTASTMSWFSWNIGEQRNMEAYPYSATLFRVVSNPSRSHFWNTLFKKRDQKSMEDGLIC
ncbi:hypothetical protein HN873_063224, partial [Arachis hypogaea]